MLLLGLASKGSIEEIDASRRDDFSPAFKAGCRPQLNEFCVAFWTSLATERIADSRFMRR